MSTDTDRLLVLKRADQLEVGDLVGTYAHSDSFDTVVALPGQDAGRSLGGRADSHWLLRTHDGVPFEHLWWEDTEVKALVPYVSMTCDTCGRYVPVPMREYRALDTYTVLISGEGHTHEVDLAHARRHMSTEG